MDKRMLWTSNVDLCQENIPTRKAKNTPASKEASLDGLKMHDFQANFTDENLRIS